MAAAWDHRQMAAAAWEHGQTAAHRLELYHGCEGKDSGHLTVVDERWEKKE
jgi:hypothetical protein